MGFLSKLLKKDERQINKPQIRTTVKDEYGDSGIPSLQGNYAKAIFLNAYSSPSPIKEKSDYQSYLLYECGINDAPAYHRQMIKEGYLREASSEEKLTYLKVADLKDILREYGLSSSGNKQQLIYRLFNEVGEEIIKNYCSQAMYTIAAKGKLYLDNNQDYIRLHKHRDWDINWKEFDIHKKPGYSFSDTVWEIFNERILKSSDFGRSQYYMMYQLLLEENKRKQACRIILHVLYLDLSGVYSRDALRLYKSGILKKDELYGTLSVTPFFTPFVICPIVELKDVFDIKYIDRIYEHRLPFNICNKELFIEIVESLIYGTFDEVYYTKRLEEQCKKLVASL